MKNLPQLIRTNASIAIAVLVLGACSLGDKTLAEVGGEKIKASELKARVNAIPNQTIRQDPDIRLRILNALIRERIVAAMAEKAGMDKKLFVQNLFTKELAVSEKEIAKYQQAHPGEFAGKPNRKDFVRAAVLRDKFDAWVEQAKATVPVKIDEAAVNAVKL